MATNFEFYKEKILANTGEWFAKDCSVVGFENAVGVAVVGNCDELRCGDCLVKIIEWLYAEHIEPPKLTKREKAFCEAVQTGWIIDFDGIAYWTNMEPVRSGEKWHFNSDSNAARLRDFKLGFEWLDAYQSCKVEDLLKLDVIDEVQEE